MSHHITHFLQGIMKTDESWKRHLITHWPEIIGPLSERVTLEKIDNDTIILGVYDSCWMQELYMLSSVLIATINKKLDHPYIRQVRFKKAGKKKEIKTPLQKKISPTQRSVPLGIKERKALTQIKDPELQSALTAFFVRCHQE